MKRAERTPPDAARPGGDRPGEVPGDSNSAMNRTLAAILRMVSSRP